MSVTLNGHVYDISQFVGYGYLGTNADTGLVQFPNSIFTDMLAELAAAVTIGALSPSTAGNVAVSNGSTWVRTLDVAQQIKTLGAFEWRGANAGGGASRGVLGFASGSANLFSYGADAVTNGKMAFILRRSDESNSITWLQSDVAGTATFVAGAVFAGPLSGISSLAGTGAVTGFTTANFSSTMTLGANLVFSAASARIIPGVTDFSIRNNANTQNNIIVTDAGAATVRAGLTVTAGGLTVSAGTTATQALTAAGLLSANAGLTVASGQTLTVTGATITGLTADSVATGTFPGVYTITGALTLSAALTYGGVTLSNAVTGTGNMVLSASPTFTGTAAFASITASTIVAPSLVAAAGSALTLGADASNWVTISTGGIVGFNTTNTGLAAAGDIVLANGAALRIVDTIGGNTVVLLSMDASRNVSISAAGGMTTFGGGTGGITCGSIIGGSSVSATVQFVVGNTSMTTAGISNSASGTQITLSGTSTQIVMAGTSSKITAQQIVGTGGLSSTIAGTFQNGANTTTTVSIQNADTTGNNIFVTFKTEASTGTVRGTIDFNRAGVAVRYNTTSDKRLKFDLGIATDVRVLREIEIHDFIWRETNYHSVGVFSQDALHVKPDAVRVGTSIDDPWGFDYSKLVPDLVVGWQYHERRFASVEDRVSALEAKLAA